MSGIISTYQESSEMSSGSERIGVATFALMVLMLFTSSFDIFMSIDIAGYNIRLTMLLAIMLIIVWGSNVMQHGRVQIPVGFISLIIWACFISLFFWNTSFVQRNIMYLAWLYLFILSIIAVANTIKTESLTSLICKWYLGVFVLCALFGILQFFIGYVGLKPPLIADRFWWSDRLPRVHGFSFEPSYYASYLIIGWSMLAILIIRRSDLISYYVTRISFIIITIAIFMSGARTGITFISTICLVYMLFLIFKLLTGRLHYLEARRFLKLAFVCLAILATATPIIVNNYLVFLSGTGIGEATGHSYINRVDQIWLTMRLFIQDPYIGTSLGGVGPAISDMLGVPIKSNAEVNPGMNIFVEVLAASGVFGFAAFLFYIISICYLPFRLIKIMENRLLADILLASTMALIAELFILQFNQNILRSYLWYHIALHSAFYAVSLRSLVQRRSRVSQICQ